MPQEDTTQAETPTPIPPTPEIVAWARDQFTETEIVAGIQEIRETGGLTFEQVIRDLESPKANG